MEEVIESVPSRYRRVRPPRQNLVCLSIHLLREKQRMDGGQNSLGCDVNVRKSCPKAMRRGQPGKYSIMLGIYVLNLSTNYAARPPA